MIIVLRVVKELHGPQKEMKLNKTISNIAVVIHSKFALAGCRAKPHESSTNCLHIL